MKLRVASLPTRGTATTNRKRKRKRPLVQGHESGQSDCVDPLLGSRDFLRFGFCWLRRSLPGATRKRTVDWPDVSTPPGSGSTRSGPVAARNLCSYPQIVSTWRRSWSKVPAVIAVRIAAISCSVQEMLCRLTNRDPVGSPT